MPNNTTASGRDLKVHLFNVGQGDHILIELPNGEFGIIDFYYESPMGEPPALTYLAYLARTRPQAPVISFICVSHPDKDHTLGIDQLLAWVSDRKRGVAVKNFWSFPGHDFTELLDLYAEAYKKSNKSDETFHLAKSINKRLSSIRDFIKANKGNGKGKCQVRYIQNIQTIAKEIGGEVDVISLAPLDEDVERFNRETLNDLFKRLLEGRKKGRAQKNAVSSILKLVFGKHVLIFGGDTGGNVWLKVLDRLAESGNGDDLSSCRGNFIKVSHHGSKHSSSEELWDALLDRKKSYIGISAGRGHYNPPHPHRETLGDIRRVSARNGSEAELVATNACHKCIEGLGLHSERVDWFDLGEPDTRGAVREGLRQDRSARYKKQPSAPTFLGYVFTFSARSKKVWVTKMVTSGWKPPENCIYGGKRKQLFPACA